MVSSKSKFKDDASDAWNDPELWVPKGLGCSHCHERTPIIWGLPFGALCDVCLQKCFAGWVWERLVQWLGAQNTAYQRQLERYEAIRAYRKGNDRLVSVYNRKYGVDLMRG